MATAHKKQLLKGVEHHLFRYRHYKVAIRNLKLQLDYILPNITTSYEIIEGGTGTFNIKSTTENTAIDRIESRRALNLYEEINRYELIIQCIDEAVKELQGEDQEFIKRRYYTGASVADIADEFGYSIAQMYKIRDHILNDLLISLASVVNF